MQRIYSIDYLRGVMAMSILMYHFITEYKGLPPSETLLGKLGVYGVSTFYVISGISLFLAYHNSKWDIASCAQFFAKRFFRIAPLYWLATILMIFLAFIVQPNYVFAWSQYFYNFSLTFGFYHIRWYMPVGGWSIGNEIVFYTIFPFLMLAARNKYIFMNVLTTIFLIYLYFAFNILDQKEGLGNVWDYYINPLNQLFLFSGGVSLGLSLKFLPTIRVQLAFKIFIISCALFIFYSTHGDQINIVTGFNRIAFTVIIFLLCYSVMHLPATASSLFGRILKFFGNISYSIYLLHGVVMYYTLKILAPFFDLTDRSDKFYWLFFFALPITLLLAVIVYNYIERPMIKTGKYLTEKRDEKKIPG